MLQDAVFQPGDLPRVRREYHVPPASPRRRFYFAQVDARAFAREVGPGAAFRFPGGARSERLPRMTARMPPAPPVVFPRRRDWWLLAAGLFILFVFCLGSRGLNEPDEGRYAIMGQAMARPRRRLVGAAPVRLRALRQAAAALLGDRAELPRLRLQRMGRRACRRCWGRCSRWLGPGLGRMAAARGTDGLVGGADLRDQRAVLGDRPGACRRTCC